MTQRLIVGPKRWPQTPPSERNLQILAKCLAGARTTDIVAEFGISDARVHQLVTKYGIPRFRLVSRVRPRRRLTDEERFHAGYAKGPGCWEWGTARGYGRFNLNGKTDGAHRLAWRLAYGPIPDGLWVLHRCDNPPCVRPDHLFLGTPSDNTRDAVAKGRWSRKGKRGPRYWKLSQADRDAIRARRATGESTVVIARDYGIRQSTVSEISLRRRGYAYG